MGASEEDVQVPPTGLFVFLILFGLFVVVPIVAILSENRRKASPRAPAGDSVELKLRLEKMEAIIAAQNKQIEELKELVHVNILKAEDLAGLQQRLGPPGQ
jgi:hypothetical protein